MPFVTAGRLRPAVLFVRPRFAVRGTIFARIRTICGDYTALMQPLSLDEACLDVGMPLHELGSGTAIVRGRSGNGSARRPD